MLAQLYIHKLKQVTVTVGSYYIFEPNLESLQTHDQHRFCYTKLKDVLHCVLPVMHGYTFDHEKL